MKNQILIILSLIAICYGASLIRNKREAYTFADGAELIVGAIKTSFKCTTGGLFADQDNDCKIFHICQPQEFPDGKSEIEQSSFFCPNQTVFNQFSLTCADPDESVPCAESSQFLYLNERIGQEKALLHEDADVAKAAPLIPNNNKQ